MTLNTVLLFWSKASLLEKGSAEYNSSILRMHHTFVEKLQHNLRYTGTHLLLNHMRYCILTVLNTIPRASLLLFLLLFVGCGARTWDPKASYICDFLKLLYVTLVHKLPGFLLGRHSGNLSKYTCICIPRGFSDVASDVKR